MYSGGCQLVIRQTFGKPSAGLPPSQESSHMKPLVATRPLLLPAFLAPSSPRPRIARGPLQVSTWDGHLEGTTSWGSATNACREWALTVPASDEASPPPWPGSPALLAETRPRTELAAREVRDEASLKAKRMVAMRIITTCAASSACIWSPRKPPRVFFVQIQPFIRPPSTLQNELHPRLSRALRMLEMHDWRGFQCAEVRRRASQS